MALFERDIKKVTRGGGCLIFFGMPFFFAGSAVMFFAVTEGAGDILETIFVLLFGLLFASVGAAFMFGRAGVVIDRRRRQVSSWWGVLFPFRTKQFKLDQFTEVTITHEIRRSKNSTYSVFPVRLSGQEPVLIKESRDYAEARRIGEEIAKFTGFGIRDSGQGNEVFREPGTLDESIRTRAEREGRITECPQHPGGGKCTISMGPSEAVIDIPPPGVSSGQWAGLVLVLFVAGVIFFAGLFPMLMDLFEEGIDNTVVFVFFGAAFFFFVCLPMAFSIRGIIRSATAGQHLVVSSGRFEFNKKTKIDASQIEEIEITYLSGHAVTIRTDKQAVTLGQGLSQDELEWLRDVLLYVLTTPPGQKLA